MDKENTIVKFPNSSCTPGTIISLSEKPLRFTLFRMISIATDKEADLKNIQANPTQIPVISHDNKLEILKEVKYFFRLS